MGSNAGEAGLRLGGRRSPEGAARWRPGVLRLGQGSGCIRLSQASQGAAALSCGIILFLHLRQMLLDGKDVRVALAQFAQGAGQVQQVFAVRPAGAV